MYVYEKLQSRVRYGMRYVRLRHKEQSHASFIYYSRSHAADRSTRILVLFVLSRLPSLLNARRIVLFPSPFFFFPTHSPFRLHISRTKRAVRKHPRRMLRRKYTRQFHRPDKICLRNIYRTAIAPSTLAIVPRQVS